MASEALTQQKRMNFPRRRPLLHARRMTTHETPHVAMLGAWFLRILRGRGGTSAGAYTEGDDAEAHRGQKRTVKTSQREKEE